jgi:hypothetical protein
MSSAEGFRCLPDVLTEVERHVAGLNQAAIFVAWLIGTGSYGAWQLQATQNPAGSELLTPGHRARSFQTVTDPRGIAAAVNNSINEYGVILHFIEHGKGESLR